MASDHSATGSASDRSLSPDPAGSKADDKSKKRPSEDLANQKVTKRRAARACVSCRARKVRCDVVEGAPCGNCRWDNVECVVQESRRRKKHLNAANSAGQGSSTEAQLLCKVLPNNPSIAAVGSAALRRPSHCSAVSTSSAEMATGLFPDIGSDTHVPHSIYQNSGYQRHDSVPLGTPTANVSANASLPQASPSEGFQSQPWSDLLSQNPMLGDSHTQHFRNALDDDVPIQLPLFIRPLPPKIEAEDVKYLQLKGALTLPSIDLQNALLQSYAEFVHPYMPLLDLHEFLGIVNCRVELNGQVSLFLYQAIMFAASAFVDMQYLRDAGFNTRKAARRSFFQKTRLLYDFDYESDRLILVQALLLMTYWYETPDDQKDTWHWMGVAISLAHTIGLHRNPETTSIAPAKQRLWKRIWWSCFMRDRLIALGMRRPTRIKDEDFDVPMLTEQDFDIQALPENNTIISSACTMMRDLQMQRELAIMCIYKAKLCVCISHMLRTQYSVLIRDKVKPDNTTSSTMMLFPNKKLDNVESVGVVDLELRAWAESLPTCCQYRGLSPSDTKDGRATLAVQRTLLHMVYYTTISALHRPQFLPSSPLHAPTTSRQAQDMSRMRVRDAAMHITHMAAQLHQHRLEGFLPTTGVTVILPAMIIHLLEMKNPAIEARQRAMYGFRQCMRVMEKLREVYAAADYATGFLDAALRKAAIAFDSPSKATPQPYGTMEAPTTTAVHTPPPENAPYMTSAETAFQKPMNPRMMLPPNTINAAALDLTTTTPPQTEFDPIATDPMATAMTPSASGGSEEPHVEVDAMDMDLTEEYEEFDWNALAGTDVDVDQWLQFPPEGGNSSLDALAPNAFGDQNGVISMEQTMLSL